MNLFRNMEIRTKILSLIVLMTFFIGTVGGIGYYYNQKANTQMTGMYSNNLMSIENVINTRADMLAGEAELYEFMIITDKNKQQKQIDKMKTLSDSADKSFTAYTSLSAAPYEVGIQQKIKLEISIYRAERQKAIDIALKGDPKGSYEYFNINVQSHIDSINSMFKELVVFNEKQADDLNIQNDVDSVTATRILILIPLLAGILCLLLGLMVANMISNSIKKVLASVERVAVGDLSIEDVVIKGNDEAGQLATSFNTMKNNLHGLVKHVSESSEQVAASSEELSAISEEGTQAANQIAVSIERVAQGAEKEAAAIDETTSAIEQISSSTQEVAASSSVIVDSMAKELTTTQAGKEALDRAVQQMNSIRKGTDTVQERITELSTSSEKIGNILQLITGIADQTNLLALNAAIEAARAGEHGRGFAVVAEEVRKLAEQSREATTQISALINQNGSNIGLVVTAMEGNVKNVAGGIEVVNVAGQSFSEIAKLVENVSAQMEEISATIQEIASGSQQILTSAEQIDITGKETASHTQTVSAGVEEQTASMEQIASSAQSLAIMASEMQNVISKFTI
jgi:methyl-accepting chemotaxis protein